MSENAPTPLRPIPGTPTARRRTPDDARTILPAYVLGSPYALTPASRITQCPPPPPDLTEPSPAHLTYALTLPSAAGTPQIAQEAAESILDVHGVEEPLLVPMLALIHELTLHACRFTGAGDMVHLVLRGTPETLQALAHDTHAPHTHPRLADQCTERRRVSLAVFRDLSAQHHADWGFTPAPPPATGMCTWTTLTRAPYEAVAEEAA
ncbi:hypothetical protein SRB5_51920 [Streptomyces sp. RB5]|uniref:Regulatory protein n=1 Tax=Streptomyces smaragdinus TaxID=2585196 RepID=A0A7K0CNF4_9ACTN|nr:ATP-binding protein [Streptomyces smaragdinus]MQY15015.1 hypothetical protein [Streptomyces smaragdinus]